MSQLPEQKPGHGTVVTLIPGTPWVETHRWDPAEAGAGPFPPST
jgi:hypothetical protein